jgi:phosphohistidine swiveling domain-containing protein
MKNSLKEKWILMNEEDGVPLWNIIAFCQAFTRDFPKYSKLPSCYNIFEFKNYHFRGFFLEQASQDTERKLFSRVLRNPKYFTQVKNHVVKGANQFYQFGKRVLALDVPRLTDNELLRLFDEYHKIFSYMIGYGMISTLIDIPHATFTRCIENFLQTRVEKLGLGKSAAEFFQALSSVNEISKVQEEQVGLLKLLKYTQHNHDKELLRRKIKQHVEQFAWVYYGYMGPAFTEKRVLKELRALRKGKVRPSVKLSEIAKNARQVKEKMKKAEKELKLTAREKQLFEALRNTIRMKIIRKDALTFVFYALEKPLREVAKRAKISLANLQYALPSEFDKVLKGNKKIIEDLPKRRKYAVYADLPGKPQLLTGQKARKLFKTIYREEKLSGTAELKGQIACPGKRTGKVKIINLPKEMVKMKPGDILVSIATTPDIVPAMKKAAAIVTEQGGITSHAAIVSRELGIPCVIGTKIATKVFKDGDFVEVDANKGIVRKLNNS